MTDNNTISRRRFLEATGGAATAVTLAGCAGGGGETTTTTQEQETETTTTTTTQDGGDGKTLELVEGTVTTIDPVAATDTESGRIIQNVFEALMNYPAGQITVENLLAADYEVSDDFTTYTFTLEDATFHNGDPVTASDFIYAWERLAASENSRRAYFILDSIGIEHETDSEGNYEPGTLGLEAPDEKTLVVNMAEPFHSALEMLAYTSFSAVPEGIVGDIPDYDGEMEYNQFATKNPIGAGPFKFEKWEQGTEVSITRNDDYYGEKAKLASVHWQIIEDDNAHFNYFQNKNADISSIPTSFYDPSLVNVEEEDNQGRKLGTYGPMRNGDTADYVGVPTLSTFYVGFNMSKVPKPVRQAFAYAMNQKTMVDQVFKGRGDTAYHLTPPTIYPGGAKEAQAHVEDGYPYGVDESQLDKAQQVMEEAGYSDSNRFEIQWTQYESSTWEEMAKILRDQLASAYIDMKIQKAPFSTLLQRGRSGNLEAYTLGWIADWPAADNFLQLLNPPQTDTSMKGPISYVNWTPENGDAAQQATDAYKKVQNNPAPTDSAQQARNEAYAQIEEANWEDVAFLNIYHRLDELFYYPWVDITPFGGMGFSRQKLNKATVGERQ